VINETAKTEEAFFPGKPFSFLGRHKLVRILQAEEPTPLAPVGVGMTVDDAAEAGAAEYDDHNGGEPTAFMQWW
jgi:hypothetical protein